jgi:hypothetical protein
MIGVFIVERILAILKACGEHWMSLLVCIVGTEVLRRVVRYYNSPMYKQGIPGPFLAGFTSWYRFYYADITHNWHDKLVKLHDKYGTIVWIAPDEISISDPKLRAVLYSFADERKEDSFFPKSKSFGTGQFNDDFNFVFETDPARARLGKYALSHPYSEKGLAKLEHHFDQVCACSGCVLHVARLTYHRRLFRTLPMASRCMSFPTAASVVSMPGLTTSCLIWLPF